MLSLALCGTVACAQGTTSAREVQPPAEARDQSHADVRGAPKIETVAAAGDGQAASDGSEGDGPSSKPEGVTLAEASISGSASDARAEETERVSDAELPEEEAPAMVTPVSSLAPELASEVEVERPRISDGVRARILELQPLVREKALAHGLSPELLNGIIWVESKFERRAKGPAGALGLMQLMPRTARALAKRLGRKSRPYDPDFNLDAGALYLSRLLRRFDGDETLALAAYNRGAGRVLGWQKAGEKIPERTLAYVERVQRARAWLTVFLNEAEAEADAAAGEGEGESEQEAGDEPESPRPVASRRARFRL